MKLSTALNFVFLIVICVSLASCKDSPAKISIILDSNAGSPVEHGLTTLMSSLEKNNITIEKVSSVSDAKGEMFLICGIDTGSGEAAQLLKAGNQKLPAAPESLTLWETEVSQKPAWIISGTDDRGLMYALLDVADRISWSSDPNDPLREVVEITESPDVTTRAISLYTMNQTYWESRFYDEAYWIRYMDMLVKNRFNSMVVIFGYENGGFLAPCYPYFFNVDGYPDIKMGNVSEAEQTRNLVALNKMISLAHERGIEFKVGIWDHIYRGGVQTGGISKEELAEMDKSFLVQGIEAETLSEYTKAALAKFIKVVPDLDGLQLRMHNESGLKRGKEMTEFWREVFGMLKTASPDIKIDLRAKELPESIIQVASDMGLNFTVATKYWMEQMGMPFHPTHINRENQHDRRHGYADMLRYPRSYKLHWRIWTGGTQRILLWGDPEYVRRFAESSHLYDGEGFEINEPLATKMEAQPHDMEPFNLLNPEYVYYDYEFERYWYFFMTFGRVAYNPNTSPKVWSHEFDKRFGNEAGSVVQEALDRASNILPRIVSACSPYGKFPTTRGWAEKQRFGNLPEYARAEGSDIQQFASFDTEAQLLIEGGETAKRLPSATSLWFRKTHFELEGLIESAKTKMSDASNKEFVSTITDLSILSNLALYHSYRIPAAVSYRIYLRTNDLYALDDAIAFENKAIEAWGKIVKVADDIYAPNLMMGVREAGHGDMIHHLTGHWRDEYGYLEEGLDELKSYRNAIQHTVTTRSSPEYKDATLSDNLELFQIEHQRVDSSPIGEEIKINAQVKAKHGVKWVRLRYRAVNQTQDYLTLPMVANEGDELFQVTVLADQIDPTFDFMYFIEVIDNNGNGAIYPDLEVETPYIIVKLER